MVITQSVPHKNWMKDCPLQDLCPVRHLCPVNKEYTSVNIPTLTTLTMFISITSITAFQKRVTVSIWMFNNLLLNKRGGMPPQYELPYYKQN